MQALLFEGTYEDRQGTEALLWQIVPSSRYGRMRWYEIRTTIRDVAVWGMDFDGLSPDDPDTARAASLARGAGSRSCRDRAARELDGNKALPCGDMKL